MHRQCSNNNLVREPIPIRVDPSNIFSSSHATDRCYTCSTDVPFCHWETYIDPASPTLLWFDCISSKIPDATFYASSVTNNLTVTSQTSTPDNSSSPLTPGAIGGIAGAGAAALIACVAILAWCCFRRRSKPPKPQEMPSETTMVPPVMYYEQHHELPDQDPQKLAWGTVPLEVASTPVAELSAEYVALPPQHLYDEHGFLHDEDRISPQSRINASPGQESLVPMFTPPSVISTPSAVPLTAVSPSPAQSPPHLEQREYFPPPPSRGRGSSPQPDGRPSVPPGHYAPNGLAYGRYYASRESRTPQ